MGVEDTTPVYRPFRGYMIYVEGLGVLSRRGVYTYDPREAAIFYKPEKEVFLEYANHIAQENVGKAVQVVEAPDMFLVYIVPQGKFIKDLYTFTLTSIPAYAERFLGDTISEVRYMIDSLRVEYRILHIC